MRYFMAVLCLILLAGCGSKPAPDSLIPNSGTKSETKEQKAARELEGMLMDPPADLIEAIGAEVYPGARVLNFMKALKSEVAGKVKMDYVFFSNDDAKKIRDFYVGKLTDGKNGEEMMEKMGTFVAKGKNSKGQEVVVQASGLKGKTTFHYVVTL